MMLLSVICVILIAALIAVCIAFAVYRKKAKGEIAYAQKRAKNIRFPKEMIIYCSEIIEEYPDDCLIWKDSSREEYLVELYRIMLDLMVAEIHLYKNMDTSRRSLRLLWDLRRSEYRYIKAVISYCEDNHSDKDALDNIRRVGPSRIYRRFDEFLKEVPAISSKWVQLVSSSACKLDGIMRSVYNSSWYEPRTSKNTENPEKYGF